MQHAPNSSTVKSVNVLHRRVVDFYITNSEVRLGLLFKVTTALMFICVTLYPAVLGEAFYQRTMRFICILDCILDTNCVFFRFHTAEKRYL